VKNRRIFKEDETIKFTLAEVQLAIHLVSKLEADKYVSTRAKALIYKAKDFAEGSKTGRIDYIEVIR
jgi:hypothetical protein